MEYYTAMEMDKLLLHIMIQMNRTNTEEYVSYHSNYIKFRSRKNYYMKLEVRMVVALKMKG